MEVVLHLPVVPNVELVAAKAVETLGGALGMHQHTLRPQVSPW